MQRRTFLTHSLSLAPILGAYLSHPEDCKDINCKICRTNTITTEADKNESI
jgi:hypothetical protein